jgi:Xaa-Pro aminopeptidase
MSADLYIARREKLADSLQDGENCIVFAKSAENLAKFTQDNNFLYLTALNHPELIYVAGKFGAKFNECSSSSAVILNGLFGKVPSSVWRKPCRSAASSECALSGRVLSVLSGMCPMMKVIHANIGFVALNRPLSLPMHMLEPIRTRHPQIQIRQLNDLIAPLRKIKDDWELTQLQKAIDLTGKGIVDVMEQAAA